MTRAKTIKSFIDRSHHQETYQQQVLTGPARMTTREPADWQRPSRTRLETVYETREESSEDPEDRGPASMQRADSAASMASTQPSTPTTRTHERLGA